MSDLLAGHCRPAPLCTPSPDHLLIELCRRADVIGTAIDSIVTNETEESYADEQTGPLYEELGAIHAAIIGLRAQTLAGIIAKAWHVRWCWAGDLSGMDDLGIVRDLLAMHPAPFPHHQG